MMYGGKDKTVNYVDQTSEKSDVGRARGVCEQ
jgi:hypothetical protein